MDNVIDNSGLPPLHPSQRHDKLDETGEISVSAAFAEAAQAAAQGKIQGVRLRRAGMPVQDHAPQVPSAPPIAPPSNMPIPPQHDELPPIPVSRQAAPPPPVAPPPYTPPPEPAADPARADVLATVERSAAERLKREQAEFEQRVAERERLWEEQQAVIREAQELRAWKAEHQRMMRADLPTYLKQVGGYNDDEAVKAATLLWERGDGEGMPAEAKKNIETIRLEQTIKAMQGELRQSQIQLRQYMYEQEVMGAAQPIMGSHKLVDGLRREDPGRFKQELHRSINELATTTGKLPTADQILAHAEKRLTHEAAFWAKIHGSPAQQPVEAPKQNSAIQAPAALTTGLSAAPAQLQSVTSLPEDDRQAWKQAWAEGQARYGGQR